MDHPLLRRAFLAAIAALTITSIAHADWPHDALISGVPVATGPSFKSTPKIASDGSGGSIIAWRENRSSSSDIYAQRLNSFGVPLWTTNGIAVCTDPDTQLEPQVIPDGAGGAIVVWKDARSSAGLVPYAQRLTPSGTPLWATDGVPLCPASASSQEFFEIVTDGTGGVVAVWQDTRSANGDIYAQRLDAAGSRRWGNGGLAICTTPEEQSQPALLAGEAGDFYVAWSDRRNDATSDVDIWMQRIDSTGATHWLVDGVAVVQAPAQQSSPKLASDGVSGAYVVWNDGRSGTSYDIYAQHMLSNGLSVLPANGLAISTAANDQLAPRAASDGSGGVFIVWQDGRSVTSTDVYAARLDAAGTLPWGVGDQPVCTNAAQQITPQLIADGFGGAIVLWEDYRSGNWDLYSQRLTGPGGVSWAANGVPLALAGGDQIEPGVMRNPDGSIVATWRDQRSVTSGIYAHRLDRWGHLGRPEPQITQTRDIAGDQGGFVKVTWAASYLDADPTFGIAEYRVFRSAPVTLAQAAAARRAVTYDSDIAVETGALLMLPNAATEIGWEYVGTQAAETFASYSRVVATTGDSSAAGNKRTQFLIEARAGALVSSPRWYSFPDSGYSVDNLAPAAPAALTGQYAAGTTNLLWQPNAEADLDHYVVYRGTSAAFAPSPANRVTLATLPGYADAAGAPYVYKVTAVDVHGNESPVATLIPSGTLGVSGGAAALSFAAPLPNPARGSTTLRFSLTQRGPVKLGLYDAAGRRVATVADGVMDAGVHSATLQLRDGAGRALPAGLYLARLEAEGRTITRRVAAIR